MIGQLQCAMAVDKFGGLGWRAYDEQFRLSVAENPEKDWAPIDNHLWLLCMTPSADTIRQAQCSNNSAKGQNKQFFSMGQERKPLFEQWKRETPQKG